MTGLVIDIAEYFEEYWQRSIVILDRTSNPELVVQWMYFCAMKTSQSQQYVEQIFVLEGQLRDPVFIHMPVFGIMTDGFDGGGCVKVKQIHFLCSRENFLLRFESSCW